MIIDRFVYVQAGGFHGFRFLVFRLAGGRRRRRVLLVFLGYIFIRLVAVVRAPMTTVNCPRARLVLDYVVGPLKTEKNAIAHTEEGR